MSQVEEAISRAHTDEWARVVATLARRFGDLDIAEEAAAESFEKAVERWPADGIPPNPGAWLTTTANRKAIDRIRRENKRITKHQEALLVFEQEEPEPLGAVLDERLRLIFTCCHPALAMENRIALTLRMVGGLTVQEIATAFLVPDTTMGQRISRAKSKIRSSGIPWRIPSSADLGERSDAVLAVLYLIFNEGYFASGETADPIRRDVTAEAIRLARLVRSLLPGNGEATGLLALMLLSESRRAGRISETGMLVPIDEQDRQMWNPDLIAEGHALVRERLVAGEAPGRYQILAAINAVHTSAMKFEDTDWSQIVALYNQMFRVEPTPIVALNRAIALSHRDGPDDGLRLLTELEQPLSGYHGFHAARADMHRRLGEIELARTAFDAAIVLADNSGEISFLTRRRNELD